MVPFDPFDFWTDNASAPPPAPSDHRRRGFVGGVARLILFALLIPWR